MQFLRLFWHSQEHFRIPYVLHEIRQDLDMRTLFAIVSKQVFET